MKLTIIEQQSIQSFIQCGHQYHLYLYNQKIEGIPKGVVIKNANEIILENMIFKYGKNQSLAPFSDLFRYRLLYLKGGWWADLDFICLKSWQKWNRHKYVFISEKTILKGAFKSKLPYKIVNGIIKVPRNSSIMDKCYQWSLRYRRKYLNWKEDIMKIGKEDNSLLEREEMVKITKGFEKEVKGLTASWKGGPKLLARQVSYFGLGKYRVEPEIFMPIDWWDTKKIFKEKCNLPLQCVWKGEKGWPDKDIVQILRNSYSIHLFNELLPKYKINKNTLKTDKYYKTLIHYLIN